MAEQLQELRELLNRRFEELMGSHKRAVIATESVRKSLEKDADWQPIPAEGFYYRSESSEIHGSLLLPLMPDYSLVLKIANPTYPELSTTCLVLPRTYAHMRVGTFLDGHEGLTMSIEEDLAPRGFVEALHLLLSQDDARAWIEVQKPINNSESSLDQNEMHRVAVVAYPFRRDLSFNNEANSWPSGNELYFDTLKGSFTVLTLPE